MTVCRSRRVCGLLLLCLLLSFSLPLSLDAQTPEPTSSKKVMIEAWLDEMLAQMTTADKVGQLFLVTFRGNDLEAGSAVADLVQRLRVGGVILSPENENFVNDTSTPEQVLSLTTALQRLAFTQSFPITVTQSVPVTVTSPLGETGSSAASEPLTVSTSVTVSNVITLPPQGIPLFVAASQEGDGYPYTAFRGGFTPLPSPMAVGATWDEENAEAIGRIVGQELSAV
ncbi:MAG: glycoside hydrolase family 3 N-terminal domain-containing protein, partial [Anaerolineae bacterium]